MRYRIPLLAVAALMTAAAAYAGKGGGQNMAGCGWGKMLFEDNKNTKGVQSTAATTNGTLYNQIFGITSGTAGCTSEGGFAKLQREQFAAVNFRSLSRELSVGQGEYAAAFATALGCRSEAVPAFLSRAKERYDRLFPAEGATPEALLAGAEAEIVADAFLSQACTL